MPCFFSSGTNFECQIGGVYLTQFGEMKAEPNAIKRGQFHYSVRQRRRRLLSDEQLLALAVGLTVGALGLWLILRVSN